MPAWDLTAPRKEGGGSPAGLSSQGPLALTLGLQTLVHSRGMHLAWNMRPISQIIRIDNLCRDHGLCPLLAGSLGTRSDQAALRP